jgi:hypothetical protein
MKARGWRPLGRAPHPVLERATPARADGPRPAVILLRTGAALDADSHTGAARRLS